MAAGNRKSSNKRKTQTKKERMAEMEKAQAFRVEVTLWIVVAAALHDFGNRDKIPPSITSSIGNILALCEENVKETGRPEEKIGRTDKKALLRVSDFLFVKNSKNCAKRRCRNVFLQFLQQGDMRRERRNSDRKNGENSG